MRLFLPSCLLLRAAFGATREVAITIDDLPRGGDTRVEDAHADLQMTERLLRAFKDEKIPLTGFVNECHRTAELQSILQLWQAAGAGLGNHTCSHADLSSTAPVDFEKDIVDGEAVTTALVGHRPTFFRYPFLHTGMNWMTRKHVETFLRDRGYRIAPVSVDNDDYVFARVYAIALTKGDLSTAAHVKKTYLDYMEAIFSFFEHWSIEVAGHEIRQVLLIHASQLNADAMPDLLAMFKKRSYRFESLERALRDPAYKLPDTYVGPKGISSIHRWALSKGWKVKWEPDPPGWVMQAYKANTDK